MKKIIYAQPDGVVAVVSPAEGNRFAHEIKLADGTVRKSASGEAAPADSFLRGWPVEGAVAVWAETEDDFIKRVAEKAVPKGISYQIIDASEVPTDRTFRNAWKAGIGCVEHDMAKCRTIHRDRLRRLRAPKLAALDAEYLRADERGDIAEKQRIAQRKQALRDVTVDPRIDAAATPDELKVVVPETLA